MSILLNDNHNYRFNSVIRWIQFEVWMDSNWGLNKYVRKDLRFYENWMFDCKMFQSLLGGKHIIQRSIDPFIFHFVFDFLSKIFNNFHIKVSRGWAPMNEERIWLCNQHINWPLERWTNSQKEKNRQMFQQNHFQEQNHCTCHSLGVPKGKLTECYISGCFSQKWYLSVHIRDILCRFRI